MKELSEQKDIIIRKADKGGVVVIVVVEAPCPSPPVAIQFCTGD